MGKLDWLEVTYLDESQGWEALALSAARVVRQREGVAGIRFSR